MYQKLIIQENHISDAVILENLDYVLLSSFGLGYTSYGSREGERNIIKKLKSHSTAEKNLVTRSFNFFIRKLQRCKTFSVKFQVF